MEGLTVGRMVHYVLPEGKNKGEHRAATVVRVWKDDLVNLTVHVDGEDDVDGFVTPYGPPTAMRKTSVRNDEDKKLPGTWHWIERA